MTDRGELIVAARVAAVNALTAAAGGDSLCTLSRERLPAAKYHEGAVAALGEALRLNRAGRPAPPAETWGAQWARLAEQDLSWRAYLVGGREALGQL